MTLEQIQKKVSALHAQTRRDLLRSIAIPILIAALCAYGLLLTRSLTLFVASILAIAWSLVGQMFLHRGMWAPVLPGEAAANSCLESYRREVNRRYGLFHNFLQWSLGPIVLALAIFLVELNRKVQLRGAPLLNIAPFCTLLVIWAIGVYIQRSRARKDLRRELDDLSRIESATEAPRQ